MSESFYSDYIKYSEKCVVKCTRLKGRPFTEVRTGLKIHNLFHLSPYINKQILTPETAGWILSLLFVANGE